MSLVIAVEYEGVSEVICATGKLERRVETLLILCVGDDIVATLLV